MLPDWVFRAGWGTPVAYEYLQLRMEADQLGVDFAHARKVRKELNKAVAKRKRPRDLQNLRWAIKTSVPAGDSGKGWGDLYFARELAESLSKLGHTARVDLRTDVISPESADDDVVLVLRGVERIRPQAGALNILWVISHPDRISRHELKSFDSVFAASKTWAEETSKSSGVQIVSLLQATNPEKFNPSKSEPDTGHDVLFVGNTRNRFRQVIKDCVAANLSPAIYGNGWDEFVTADLIKGNFVSNDQLAEKYRSAGIVLNDHWLDMARHGFLSNRLFDAVASGARVISDGAAGIEEIFGKSVAVYKGSSQLKDLCSPSNRATWGSQVDIATHAYEFGIEHSFDQRAKVLVRSALNSL